MPRIEITLPTKFPFQTEIPLRISDINRAGHLDNALLFNLVSEARRQYFNWLGYVDSTTAAINIIVVDDIVQYRSEAFYGEKTVVEIGLSGCDDDWVCDLSWRIFEARSGRDIARGITGLEFIDAESHGKVHVPDLIRQHLPG